jgi:succinate dehydrogenase hydrophobic anchor subunit
MISQFVSKNFLPLPKASQVLLFKLNSSHKFYTNFTALILLTINYHFHAGLPKIRADAENPVSSGR